MRLLDNPILIYALRRRHRARRLWILPALTVLVLCLGIAWPPFGRTFEVYHAGYADAVNLYVGTEGGTARTYDDMLVLVLGLPAAFLVPALLVPIYCRLSEPGVAEAIQVTPMTNRELALGMLAGGLTPFFLAYAVTLPTSVAAIGLSSVLAPQLLLAYLQCLTHLLAIALVSLSMAAWLRTRVLAVLAAYAFSLVVVPIVGGLIWAWTMGFFIVLKGGTLRSPLLVRETAWRGVSSVVGWVVIAVAWRALAIAMAQGRRAQ